MAGVAAGLARYLGVDVMIVRIAFVVLALFSGSGIPLYLAGLLLIPEEGHHPMLTRCRCGLTGTGPPHWPLRLTTVPGGL